MQVASRFLVRVQVHKSLRCLELRHLWTLAGTRPFQKLVGYQNGFVIDNFFCIMLKAAVISKKRLRKEKISKMTGVSLKETERRLALQLDPQFISGVF
jgi:hypothetical protein